MDELLTRIFTETLRVYLNTDNETVEKQSINPGFVDKERVCTINHLEVIIYPNDHNPPHFHVKSKDRKIDAKFYISSGELYNGEISSQDAKRVMVFYQSDKGKKILEKIWLRYNS